MLSHRRGRWPNIKATLGGHHVFACFKHLSSSLINTKGSANIAPIKAEDWAVVAGIVPALNQTLIAS